MQILLVEDDSSLANGLMTSLTTEGFVVNHIDNGTQAELIIAADKPDVVILDLGLPDMDGVDVLKQIRQSDPDLPVLILTARSSLDDKVSGLDAGADDYLAKPFDIPELLARLRVLGRRLSTQKHAGLKVGEVLIESKHQLVKINDEIIDLSRREYLLLKTLMENAGRVQTRQSLESRLYSWDEELASNALEVHIHHLRKKLPEKFIKTIRGVGYTIKAE
jgi:DNA-binding response OmpR family regulator